MFKKGRPVSISYEEFKLLTFDKRGYHRLVEAKQLASDQLEVYVNRKKDVGNLVDFKSRRVQKEKKKREWIPTTEEREALRKLIPGLV